MHNRQYVKKTVKEEVDPNTGEVKMVGVETEIIGSTQYQSFLSLRTTDGLGHLRVLCEEKKVDKYVLLTIMAYHANINDSSVYMPGGMLDDVAVWFGALKKNGRPNRRAVQKKLNEMIKDCVIVELYSGKYMINPHFWMLRGSKFYQNNCKRFKDALTIVQNRIFKEAALAEKPFS